MGAFRGLFSAVSLSLLSGVGIAGEDRSPMTGTWGTPAQCARQAVVAGGSHRAAPFEITGGWLRHGLVWCKLSWYPAQPQAGGIFAVAQALCGEDSALTYRLALRHRSGPPATLVLIWDDAVVNGPLHRCAPGQ